MSTIADVIEGIEDLFDTKLDSSEASRLEIILQNVVDWETENARDDGYDAGYSDGRDEGYDQGYEDGREDAE